MQTLYYPNDALLVVGGAEHYPVTTSFSDGSATGYEYPYIFDRGGPSLSSSSTLPATSHATGLSEPGNPSYNLPYQQSWNLPSSHGSFKSVAYSAPAPAKLPTPSEMAILMRPNAVDMSPPIIPPTPLAMVSDHLSAVPPEEEFTLARERKHACSMCHKRYAYRPCLGSLSSSHTYSQL